MRITSIDTTQILLLLLKPNQAFLSISSERSLIIPFGQGFQEAKHYPVRKFRSPRKIYIAHDVTCYLNQAL